MAVTDSIIAISLDKYLGRDYVPYERLGWPEYLRYRMEKHMIPTDCMFALATTEFTMDETRNSLLDNMIYYGQIMYFMDAVLPNAPDSLKMGYSVAQRDWCEENEGNMWLFLVENKKLFTTDYKEIRRYTGEAPFTAGFSQESPGRSGIWLGWQIVRSYMDNNPQVTVQELMANTDYQKVLNNSRYDP